jgi:hypothetical protein
MNSTVELLTALCGHLAEFELPPIASVHVSAALAAPRGLCNSPATNPPRSPRGLLAWADTLTQVTARAWRVPRTDSVHLSVTGLLPDGASVLIYGGLWGTHRGLGADLPPNAITTISLATLRHAATIEGARAGRPLQPDRHVPDLRPSLHRAGPRCRKPHRSPDRGCRRRFRGHRTPASLTRLLLPFLLRVHGKRPSEGLPRAVFPGSGG